MYGSRKLEVLRRYMGFKRYFFYYNCYNTWGPLMGEKTRLKNQTHHTCNRARNVNVSENTCRPLFGGYTIIYIFKKIIIIMLDMNAIGILNHIVLSFSYLKSDTVYYVFPLNIVSSPLPWPINSSLSLTLCLISPSKSFSYLSTAVLKENSIKK